MTYRSPGRLLVLACVWMTLGAAEFPGAAFDPFRMEEFDEALQRQNVFEDTVPDQIDVPRVTVREYGTQDLDDRYPIEGIVIEGVVPYPGRDITLENIQALIDRRFQEERAIELNDYGFTDRDMDDIGRFLRELVDRGGADREDLDNLLILLQRLEFRRGWLTVEQLDAIALSVTEYYRERGFILATAFVPEQEVTDGIVRLGVLEGRLGEVTVSNNQIFEPEVISAAFAEELGQPVTEQRIESALRRINDLPGVRVRGSFSPGENVGETALNLGVLEEQPWQSTVLLDNHGADTTGETRLFATTEWLNLFDRGHRALVGLLRSEGPDSSLYGLAEYEVPVTRDGRGRVRGSISTNQFAVSSLGVSELDIVGETDNFGVTGTYQFIRGRTLNIGAQAGFTYKDVLFDVAGAPLLSRDEQIQVGTVAVNYNQLWDNQQLLLSGRLGIDVGDILDGAARDQSTNFTKVLLSANLLKRFSINNWLTKDESFFNFVVRLNAQYSEQFLSSVEQFSLGGPNAVRAFGVSDVSVDSGAYAGFELFFDSPVNFSELLRLPFDEPRPFVFADYAYGVARTALGNINRDAEIKGWGLGVRLNWPGWGSANIMYAEPHSAKFDDDFSDAIGESRVFIDIQYNLR